MNLQQKLINQILEKSQFQRGQEVSPVCILWPDKNLEWKEFVPLLSNDNLPVLTLDSYNPQSLSGPALYILWNLHHGVHAGIPVVYLPGVGAEDLKASDTCPLEWQPLAALRYQSSLFIQPNGKDWTISSWFSSASGAGLTLQETDQARVMLRSSFRQLLQKPVTELSSIMWTTENLTGAVVNDPVLSALLWLGGGKSAVPSEHWAAFIEKANQDFGFKPEKQTMREVATMLLSGESTKLEPLWSRFLENPARYPDLISLFESVPIPTNRGDSLFEPDFSRYPQWFKKRHEDLTNELLSLGPVTDQFQLISYINKLWSDYKTLEISPWVTPSTAPLLDLLKNLRSLATAIQKKPTNHDWPSLITWYSSSGLEADNIILQLLGWKNDLGLRTSLQSMLQALYLPWLESTARIVEEAYKKEPEYFSHLPLGSDTAYIPQEAVIFVDALRMDLGQALAQKLERTGLLVEIRSGLTVLPSTTSTAKAAVSPLAPFLKGGTLNSDDAYPLFNGKPCNADALRKGLIDMGWSILQSNQLDIAAYGWLENSEIDSRGHEGMLPDQWPAVLDSIVFTIQKLLEQGWKRVRVVTDHGFLLTPLDLPKTKLPPILVDSKGGRAAIMKPNSEFPNTPVPWFWDPVQNYNVAPGITTFYQSKFAHGGLTLQELVVPMLLITSNDSAKRANANPVDATLIWKGLRLRIGMDEHPENWKMDLRLDAGDTSTSLLGGCRPLASSVAVDDDYLGKKSHFLIIDENGVLVFQKDTIIGE